MEVHIISRELIKPSSPAIQYQKPYELSLLDQLTPATYSTFIFIYKLGKNDSKSKIIHLKNSLSQALDLYYPLSGRVVDNLVIDRFYEGVSFLEAQVNCSLSHYLEHHEIESLNHLLPYQPFTKEDMSGPIFACQVSLFSCGGMAFSVCGSHKLIDAGTWKAFSTTWTSISLGDVKDVVPPALTEASQFFRPRKSVPQNHLSLVESLWFKEGNYITRRFVFNAKAIAKLKAKAANGKPDQVRTSRVEVLSCFIWKCCMSATKAISSSGLPKPSILVEAVNLRPRTKPPMSDASIGNIFWWATAVSNTMNANTELHDLVNLLNDAIALYDTDYIQSLQGEGLFEYFNQLEGLFSIEMPDIFAFTSWCNLGVSQLNFGWGAPFWIGVLGKVGPAFRNLTVFTETMDGKGIEAWITLDHERMSILEKDPDFLAFCSPNLKLISSL